MRATVLLSGGIDSASCVHFLQTRGHDVAGVFVDFGQPSAWQENRHAELMSDYFSIPLSTIQASAQEAFGIGELAGRNAFLIFCAILLAGCRDGLLVIGIHAGTPYFDCSPASIERIDPLVQECSNGRVSVLAPFLHWSKDEVYSYFVNARIPLRQTYSCEAGLVPPCSECSSCKDRARLDTNAETKSEVERIRRVADQLSTAHASMRDRFKRLATGLDLTILLLSAWLTALAFVDPRFHPWIVPLQIDAQLWIGLIGVLTFCLTLVQLQLNWRQRSEAHERSFGMYSEVKREAGYLLASFEVIPLRDFQRLAARYDMASDVGTGIPERDFLRLKRRHRLKIKVSKLLDTRPGASIALTKLKLILRDNSPWRRP